MKHTFQVIHQTIQCFKVFIRMTENKNKKKFIVIWKPGNGNDLFLDIWVHTISCRTHTYVSDVEEFRCHRRLRLPYFQHCSTMLRPDQDQGYPSTVSVSATDYVVEECLHPSNGSRWFHCKHFLSRKPFP